MSGISRLKNPIFDKLGLNEWGQRDIIQNDFNSEIIETNQEFQSGTIDVSKIKNLKVESLDVSITGFVKSGKDSFDDDVNAGWYFSADGVYIGSENDDSYFKYDVNTGDLVIAIPDDGELLIRKGGDIVLEGDDTNPAKLKLRNPDDTAKYWELYMDEGATAEFLYLLPNGLTYRDLWIGKYDSGGATDALKSRNMLRNVFINTGNTLSSGSRPSIVFQNWNAYANKWSRLAIGNSDTKSVVEIGGDLIPDTDDTYSLGDSTHGWSRIFIGDEGEYISYSAGIDAMFFSKNIQLASGSSLYYGVTKMEYKQINYKDHSGNNQYMTVFGYNG